ncbi:hypothetical protein NDU88_003378 [Pleurodeles waltl]|uniref:Uncharacterized protein n=1 Tax=Pleurodeles waltl TaxID=8319 RepID=A0AAV7WSM0_PLEWA|nr:hypothetical protein NDU88_003378 [Pleurodeles waltl]
MELRPWRKPPTKTATLTLRLPRRYKQTALRSPPTQRHEDNVPPTESQPTNPPPFLGRIHREQKHGGNRTLKGKRSPLHTPRGTRTPWNQSCTFSLPLSSCSSTRCTNAGGKDHRGFVPIVLHPATGGHSSVSALGAHGLAVLVAAVSLAAVLVAAVSCSAVLVATVSCSAVLVAVVSCSAVLVAAVSCSAVLVAAVSWAATQLLAVLSGPEGLVLAVLSGPAGLVLAVTFWPSRAGAGGPFWPSRADGGGLLDSGDDGGGLLGSGDDGGGLLGSGDDGGLLRRAALPRLAEFLVPLPHLGRCRS